MTEPYASLWDQCLSIIKKNVNEKSFNTWFNPIKPIKYENNVLTIQVPNKFFYDWIEEHFLGILKKSIYQVLGPNGQLEYKIVVEKPKKIKAPQPFDSNTIKNPFVIPGLKKSRIQSNLNPKSVSYTHLTLPTIYSV